MRVVLVVDDSPAIRGAINMLLRVECPQIRVIEATNGQEGVALAKAEKPDLILMDASMPVMNGLQAAQQLRASKDTNQIPLIAITANSNSDPTAKGLRALCNASLMKPFSVDELLRIASQLWQTPVNPAYP